jgi:hypothetical protein
MLMLDGTMQIGTTCVDKNEGQWGSLSHRIKRKIVVLILDGLVNETHSEEAKPM